MLDKKIIGLLSAIAAGQAVQLLLLYMAESITYTDHQFTFCLVGGIIVIVMLLAGAFIAFCCIFSYEGDHEEPEEAIGTKPHKTYAEFKEEADKADPADDQDDIEEVIPLLFAGDTANG